MTMLMLIVCLAAPLAVAPLAVMGMRHLFAIFVREAAELFLDLDMHKAWAITLGTDIAVVNMVVFAVAWGATIGLASLHLSAFIVISPFLAAVLLALWFTRSMVKSRLRLQPGDAWMVGLLAFAGGNLPLIITIPVLLMVVMTGEVSAPLEQ